MKYFLLFLLISGCGPQCVVQDTNIFTGVDPTLKVYFDRFTNYTGVSSNGITAGFITLNGLAGECIYNGPYKEIRIDPTYWSKISSQDLLMEELMFHELGHCALGIMKHLNACSDGSNIPDGTTQCSTQYGIPLSIMNWMVFSNDELYFYATHKQQYIKALVNNIPITY